jgi:gluconokinase
MAMSSSTIVVALDIGTSSVRAIAFDNAANPLFESQIKYTQRTSHDGGVETDPDELVSISVSCLAALLRKLGASKSRISGLGISCFWHSLIGVGADNRAITPVYSWADTRAAGQIPRLRELFESSSYHEQTGCELHPCFWPAKLLWLRSEQRDLFDRVSRWMGFGEYLLAQLFGVCRSSLSMASGTGLFNQICANWDPSILDSLNIDRSALLDLEDTSPLTGLSDEYKHRLPALANVPWFAAVGDGACSNIGSGGVDERRMVLNVGTSAAIRVVAHADMQSKFPITDGLFCYRVDNESVIVGGAFANGGNVYAWLKDQFRWRDDAAFLRSMSRIKADSHGLTVLPFWSGERSPGWHSDARASILGMNLHTSSADIVRASLEACAYTFDQVRVKLFDRFPKVTEIVISGGAIANDPLFAQIVCDVFGMPLKTSRVAEASSRGAAIIALHGLGEIRRLSDIQCPTGRILRPNAEHHSAYLEGSSRYLSHYRQLIGPA